MRVVIGVDSSTQNTKAIVLELATGKVLATVRSPHPTGTEVDPEHWWAALQQVLGELSTFDDVVAISVAGQQHGMVILDDAGQVIRPALLWNDTRSADAAGQLTAELGQAEWVRRTGSVPVASFTATKLRWLADHEPDAAARIAAVCLPHDWLSWRLRGYGPDRPDLSALTTDRSDASGTSYYDLESGRWDRELLALALRRKNVSGITLPTILDPWEARLSHDGGPIICAGVGDNAGAALGLGLGPGDVAVSLGTSGTVFASTSSRVAEQSGTIACFADAAEGYLPILTTMNAARVFDTVSALLAVDHDELAELALAAAPGAGGVVLHPYFDGERTPNLPQETATFSGLRTVNTTRENVARAAFEGVFSSLVDGVDALRCSGVPVQRVLLIGGAAGSRASLAVAAALFDVPVVLPVPGEYVALGASVQAAWAATGIRPAWSIETSPAPSEPPAPRVLEQYRERFRARYAATTSQTNHAHAGRRASRPAMSRG